MCAVADTDTEMLMGMAGGTDRAHGGPVTAKGMSGARMLGGRVSSGSGGAAGGKGYSKRGEDTSKGVPRIDDGEWRERLERLRWGFSADEWTASSSCATAAASEACWGSVGRAAVSRGRR